MLWGSAGKGEENEEQGGREGPHGKLVTFLGPSQGRSLNVKQRERALPNPGAVEGTRCLRAIQWTMKSSLFLSMSPRTGEGAYRVVGIKMDQRPPLTDEETEAQKVKQLACHTPGKERARV